MNTKFQITNLFNMQGLKRSIQLLALIALPLCFSSKLQAQSFSSIINQNNGVIMAADNDNTSSDEDFIWILDQPSWTNGSNSEKMRLSSTRLRLNTAFSMAGEPEFSVDAPNIYGGRFIILPNGNVGVGTANPAMKFVVSNGTNALSFNPNSNGMDIHSNGGIFPHYQTNFTIYKGNIGAGQVKFKIDADGRVGIGTSSPSAKLEVTGSGTYSNDVLTNGRIWSGANSTAGGLWVNSINNIPTQLFGTFDNTSKMGIYNNNKWNLVADSAGNIGVGTTSPTAKLEVGGQVKITGGAPGAGKVLTSDANGLASWASNTQSQWTSNGSNLSYLTGNIGIGTTTANYQLVVANSQNSFSIAPHAAGVDLQSTGNFSPHYQTNFTIYKGNIGSGSAKLTINENGNVGIGTTTPDKAKLQVAGSFHVENTNGKQTFHVSAEKQLVFVGDSAYIRYQAALSNPASAIQSDRFSLWVSKGIVTEDLAFAHVDTWDDYVFNEDYKLPGIDTLAAFVKNYKHLPGIPSEAEVKKDGYSVHKLNRGFLKNMEEMTLYMLEQSNTIKELKAEITEQKIKLDRYEQLAAEVEQLKAIMTGLKR